MLTIQSTAAQDVVLTPPKLSLSPQKVMFAVATFIVVAIGVSVYYWHDILSTDKTLSRADLRTAKVTRGDLRKEISALGKVVVANSPTLYSSADGIVTYSVNAGDKVTKNQILLSVESPSLSSQYQQAKATLDRLKSDLAGKQISAKKNLLDAQQAAQLAALDLQISKNEFARYQKGLEKNFVSQQEYEKAEDRLRQAELKAQQAPESLMLIKEVSKTDIQNAKSQVQGQQSVVDEFTRQVDNLIIRSPVDGMIGNLAVNQKSSVSNHQALITVVDLSRYEMEVNVQEHYAPEVTPNMPVEITLDGDKYTGAVTAVAPEIQSGEVKVRLHFTGKEPSNLRQNQRVSVTILLEIHEQVLQLPRGSYVDADHGQSVFRIQANKAQRVPVQFGATSIDEIEIIKGVEVGDEIIISDTSAYKDANWVYLTK